MPPNLTSKNPANARTKIGATLAIRKAVVTG
jgi:hypothetical protein